MLPFYRKTFSRKPLSLVAAAAGVIFSNSGAALAATSAPVASALTQEELVVTATRQPTDAYQLIGNTGVVDGEALALVAHTHISESLARVSGAHINRGNGQEYLMAIRSPVLTGAGACGGILTAADGIPLRASGLCNVNELFESNTEQAARIEVIRGPATALYGSNAMHGVVNVISPMVAESTPQLRLELGPHRYSRIGLRGHYPQKQPQARQHLSFNFNATHDGGYRDDSGFDQQKLSLRHEWILDDWTVTSQLDASNLNQETAGFVVGTDAYKDEDLKDTNPNPEAYRDARALRLWSRWQRQQDDGSQWRVTPYLRDTEMEFLQHFLPGQPSERNGQQSVGVQLSWFSGAERDWQLTLGADLEYSRGYLEEFQPQPTQGSAFLQATIPAGAHYDYDVEVLMLAPYAQWRWQLDEHWQLQAGLRAETQRYDYDNNMIDGRTRDDGQPCGFGGCRFSRPADRSDHFNNLSPKLGLSYALAQQHRVYLQLANGFRAPQATELYRLQNNQAVADLESESLRSVELGIKGRFARVGYELLVYNMRKEDFIFRDSDRVNVGAGESSHRGLEVSLDWFVSEHWRALVQASFARHQYRHDQVLFTQDPAGINIDGLDVDTAPRHFGSAQLQWTPAADGLVELEWLHMGAYYTDPDNLHRYGGHDLLNLRSRWQVSPALALSARVTNLLDKDYAERADFTRFQGDRYFPGEPRSLYLGVTLSY